MISITDCAELSKVFAPNDLIEVRLDCVSIEKRPSSPCIFTLRKKEHGGFCTLPEKKRYEKIESFLKMGPDYFDLECDTDPLFLDRIAKKYPHVQLIGSYHNFLETPPDLDALLKKMKHPCFSSYKIATFAQNSIDCLRLMHFLKTSSTPLSCIALGEFGRASRVLGPIFGNVFDYVGVRDDEALGRFSLETLLNRFHYRSLTAQTPIYALIGDPLFKSPGDLFHNRCFQGKKVYVKIPLRPVELPTFFSLAPSLNFRGLSVTMPLKEKILPFLTEKKTPIDAINTVTFQGISVIGTNTDGLGALRALKVPVKGKKVALLGAGGTAKAIGFELIKQGATLLIYNRTLSRAKALAQELGAEGFSLKALDEYDLLINTIPHFEVLPSLKPNKVVLDVVYEAPLFQRAKELECIFISAEEMFVEQAKLQQEEWMASR